MISQLSDFFLKHIFETYFRNVFLKRILEVYFMIIFSDDILWRTYR